MLLILSLQLIEPFLVHYIWSSLLVAVGRLRGSRGRGFFQGNLLGKESVRRADCWKTFLNHTVVVRVIGAFFLLR